MPVDKHMYLSPGSFVQNCSYGHHVESPEGFDKCPCYYKSKACKGTLKPLKPLKKVKEDD